MDGLFPGWLEVATSLGCVAVVINCKVMDAALIAQLHGAGLHALCYTVNDPAEARRLLALGVVGIITDAVDRLLAGPCWRLRLTLTRLGAHRPPAPANLTRAPIRAVSSAHE